jgi:hypothetical protein
MSLGLRYEVGLSESGLLVKIDAYEGSRLDASLLVERHIWPSIVQAVTECMTERRVRAEVENILVGDDDL